MPEDPQVTDATPDEESDARKLLEVVARTAGVQDPLRLTWCRCPACWCRWTVAMSLGAKDPAGKIDMPLAGRLADRVLELAGWPGGEHWKATPRQAREVIRRTLNWAAGYLWEAES